MRAINFGFGDAEDPAAIVNINAVSNQLSCVAHRIKCNNIEDENWNMAIIAGNYYGIDLQALGHSRHEEYEVVSPMLSEIVIQTEVLYDND